MIRCSIRSSRPVSPRRSCIPCAGNDGRPHSSNLTANRMIISSASQNDGIAANAVTMMVVTWSNSELCRTASATPSGTATSKAITSAVAVSSSVLGSTPRMRSVTGVKLVSERPRSPCNTSDSQTRVPLVPGPVESQILADALEILRPRRGFDLHRADWAAGHETDDGEGEQGDPQQQRDHLQQAPDDVDGHDARPHITALLVRYY